MRTLFYRYARFAVAALALALLLSGIPSTARAAGPTVTIFGSSTDRCTTGGSPVPSVVQGEAFIVGIDGFPSDPVGLTFTFPDGRVLNTNNVVAWVPPIPAFADYAAWGAPVVALPGPIDPVSAAYIFGVPLNATMTWPVGCYTVTASEIGPAPNLSTTAEFALLPLSHNGQSGNLTLNVQTQGTAQPTGEQGQAVNIFGQGVPAGSNLIVQVVQPNGAIDVIPGWAIRIVQGSFTLQPYIFSVAHPVGDYSIYATVVMPSGATYTAHAEFTLTAAPVTLTNNASLEVLDPFTALVAQGSPIIFQARRFAPGTLGLTLVLPDGARFAGKSQVNASGNTQIGPLVLGKGFPTGTYTLIGTQTNPPFAIARVAQTSWQLKP